MEASHSGLVHALGKRATWGPNPPASARENVPKFWDVFSVLSRLRGASLKAKI